MTRSRFPASWLWCGRLACLAVVGLLTPKLEAASPSLGAIQPRGGQRGTELDLLFNGSRLTDAQQIMFYYPGIEATALEAGKDNQVKVHVKIAPDCRLGEHAMRVRTATGISELRTFYVGPLPPVDEKEPNTDFTAPQKIDLNVTVIGVVENEDVDFYLVEAKKGQRLSAEVEGIRLGNTLFDPYVAILDSKRFELAASDDSPLVWQDSVASIVVPEDGNYMVMVRESAYGGNGACQYRLHVGHFPRPTATLPAGGKLGDEVDVRFLGDARGEFTQKIKLPAAGDANFGLFAQDDGGIAPSPNVFRLSEHGNVLEVEPNNAHPEATPATLPLAFNGVISAAGDVDCFRFKAAKGQMFDVHCFARRVRSPLDPVMSLFHFGGGQIATNDDTGGPDSYFRFTAPEEKEYVIRVTDHLGRGGPDFVYRIEFLPVSPSLSLSIPKVAQYSQERQTIVVPRGNRYAALINVTRTNFGGELVLSAEGLPPGVTLANENMPANLSAIPVVFEAPADAPVGGALVNLTARHVDPAQNISGPLNQSVELVTGNPGQSIYWSHKVDRLAVAVADAAPFKLSIVEPKVPLVQSGSMQLKIVATRDEGFKAPINVAMLFNPPGVASVPNVTIPEGQTEVLYPINANGGAELRKWKIAVIGSADIGGTRWVSSPLTTLEIAAPYVTFAMERAAVEQGQQTPMICKIDQKTPFEGPAKVRLVGLPNKVTAEELEINKETKELVFKVTTDPASPAGNHKNLFCQVVIMVNGEPIAHSVGGTELRIDKPLPPKPNAAPPMPPPTPVAQAAPAPVAPPVEKRLTRLEQLRLDAQKKAAAPATAPAAVEVKK